MATLHEPLTRPYRVVAHFDDCHELRVALGELGVRLGEHRVVVVPDTQCLEVEVADPDEALVVTGVLDTHACDVRVLDFEDHQLF